MQAFLLVGPLRVFPLSLSFQYPSTYQHTMSLNKISHIKINTYNDCQQHAKFINVQQLVRIATEGGRNVLLTENTYQFPIQYQSEFLIIN